MIGQFFMIGSPWETMTMYIVQNQTATGNVSRYTDQNPNINNLKVKLVAIVLTDNFTIDFKAAHTCYIHVYMHILYVIENL